MIAADAIRSLRTASNDYEETEELKRGLLKLREGRVPFFLTGEELDGVFRWKLRGQYERQSALRSKIPDAAYRTVTEAAFKLARLDGDLGIELPLGVVISLPGVGVPVASAILALTFPELHCVIDFRGWRALFGEDRTSFGINDYLRYRREVARLAGELGWCVQETDLAVWEYDRRRGR